MKRIRILVLGAAGILAVGLVTYLALRRPDVNAAPATSHHSHAAAPATASTDFGILSNATVSFGSWMTSPAPLDRFPNLSPGAANNHELKPQIALIRAGGTVNFVVAGFHQVVVYGDGTQPTDIDTTITVPPTNQAAPMLIADPNRRVYRGLDPSTQSVDRVEVVHFAEPGTYLVICGVLPHFRGGMYGYVKVLK